MNKIQNVLINLIFCIVGAVGFYGEALAMELTPVQKHLEWLNTVNNEARVDATGLVSSMCNLSRYLDDYKDYNFLKRNEDALEQLSVTKKILEKVTTNVVNLSSNQNASTSLKAYNVLTALQSDDQEESTISKGMKVYNTLMPQPLPVGQKLVKALNYLRLHDCDELQRALKECDAQKSVDSMRRLSYNTQLLFSALDSKETLRRFTLNTICRDERFFKNVQDIVNSFVFVPKKTTQEVDIQKEKEKLYAERIKAAFTVPASKGLQIVEEITTKPDVSGLGYMFLNPSFIVRKALPFIEKYAWLRRLLGPIGKDIELAMNNNMAPTKLIGTVQRTVPIQFKPLLIPFLRNYGKTAVNPSLWLLNKSLFPLRFLAAKSDVFAKDLIDYGKMPSLEEQLYPYLRSIGSSFYGTVLNVLNDGDHKNRDNFRQKCFAITDDSLLIRKKNSLEKRYDEKKRELVETKLLCQQHEEAVDDEAKKAQLKRMHSRCKESEAQLLILQKQMLIEEESYRLYLEEKKAAEQDSEYNGLSEEQFSSHIKSIEAKYAAAINIHDKLEGLVQNIKRDYQHCENLSKVIAARESYNQRIQREIKKFEDDCLFLENKIRVVRQILQERGYRASDFQKEKLSFDTDSLDICSLDSLCEKKKIRVELGSRLHERFKALQERLAQCNKQIQVKKAIIDDVQKEVGVFYYLNSDYKSKVKNLKIELTVLEHEQEECKKKIRKVKEKYQFNSDKIKTFEEAIQRRLSKKEKLNELRDIYSDQYLYNLLGDTIPNDMYVYYGGLIIKNRKEFFKIVKKFYKKDTDLDSQKVQNIFNAWFIYMLEREQAPYKRKIEENISFIEIINNAVLQSRRELESCKKKKIEEVWPSYSFKTKCLAWFYLCMTRKFPIFVDHQEAAVKDHLGLYEQCLREHTLLQKEAVYSFFAATQANSILRKQKKEQRVVYNLIKVILGTDNEVVPLRDYVDVQPIVVPQIFKNNNLPYTVKYLKVKSQDNAECGYHAVFNALHSLGIPTRQLKDFLEHSKEEVLQARKERNDRNWSNSAQWLTEEEIAMLLDNQVQDDSVIFIPDVMRYCQEERRNGLNLEIINKLAKVHQDLTDGFDFERVYILGTSEEGDRWKRNGDYINDENLGHWIAIKQIFKDGKIAYEVMNSLGQWSCEDLVDNFVEKLMKKSGFETLTKEDAENRKMLIKEIEFSKAFEEGFYATQANPRRSDGFSVVINEFPHNLIDRILNASDELLQVTKGKPFHNCMGYIRPLDIVKKAVAAITLMEGKDLTVHHHLGDIGVPFKIQLNEEQKQMIQILSTRVGL